MQNLTHRTKFEQYGLLFLKGRNRATVTVCKGFRLDGFDKRFKTNETVITRFRGFRRIFKAGAFFFHAS